VSPAEPNIGDNVSITIRTALNNADGIYINIEGTGRFPLSKKRDDSYFSYYSYTYPNVVTVFKYYFTVVKAGYSYYYNKKGILDTVDSAYNFKVIPGFKTPDWAKGAVMYQIYVDRFFNGDTSNDVCDNEYIYLSKAAAKVNDWNRDVSNDDVCNFYGGDIQGIIKKLPYLKDLGIEVIFLNPVFVSPSNHKYDIQDYDYIDPHFGVISKDNDRALRLEKFNNRFADKYLTRTTDIENLEKSNELMANFIENAHDMGIKVILDGVFNHCGSFNKWMDKEGFYKRAGYDTGAYLEKDSPYHDFFMWYDDNWPNNDAYDCWWNHLNHPKLNYEGSKKLTDKIMEVAEKWVLPPFNADGWRLDVAADLGYSKSYNHKFWREFRKHVKSANPQALILAEHYGSPEEWLNGREWDSVMNYDAFMEPVTYFLTGMEKHSDAFKQELLSNAMAFEESMRYNMARFSIQALNTAMNQISNHDHSRFLTRTNCKPGRLNTQGPRAAEQGINKAVMYEAVLMQMTWPGAPAVYYGDESGLCGWTDPDSRRTYPWGKEDMDLIEFHKAVIGLRRNYSCFKRGSLEYLYNNYGLLSYGRWNDNEKAAVVINNKDEAVDVKIPVWKLGVEEGSDMSRIIYTRNGVFDKDTAEFKVLNGQIDVHLEKYSGAVFVSV
jgi:alpha-glucosidase